MSDDVSSAFSQSLLTIQSTVVIIGACRTPIGAFKGALASLSCTQLAAATITRALAHAHVDVNAVDELIMGTVCQAGVGQNPARCAALAAGVCLLCYVHIL
jgi:acetyl-CoA C-acetyltransferase